MAAKRATSISIRELSGAVDKAAKLAAGKHEELFTAGLHVSPLIIGKVARPRDFAQAERAAADLANHVASPESAFAGLRGSDPAVLVHGGVIICGFLPPPGIEFAE